MAFCIYKIAELVKMPLVPEYVFMLTALPRACSASSKTQLYLDISCRERCFWIHTWRIIESLSVLRLRFLYAIVEYYCLFWLPHYLSRFLNQLRFMGVPRGRSLFSWGCAGWSHRQRETHLLFRMRLVAELLVETWCWANSVWLIRFRFAACIF